MTHPRIRPAPRRSGYTLIEIVIVLLIVGILAALAVPRMDGWLGVSRLESAMNGFRGDVAYARTLALRSGRPVIVRVEQRRYVIRTIHQNGDTVVARMVDFTQDDPILQFSAQPTAVPLTLRFNSRGILEEGPVSTISASRAGRTISVTVLQTGRVHRD